MQPIDKLLDRIRWDRELGAAVEIGYYDRVAAIIGGDSEVWTGHDAACTHCLVLVEPQGMKNRGTVARGRKNFGKPRTPMS